MVSYDENISFSNVMSFLTNSTEDSIPPIAHISLIGYWNGIDTRFIRVIKN